MVVINFACKVPLQITNCDTRDIYHLQVVSEMILKRRQMVVPDGKAVFNNVSVVVWRLNEPVFDFFVVDHGGSEVILISRLWIDLFLGEAQLSIVGTQIKMHHN